MSDRSGTVFAVAPDHGARRGKLPSASQLSLAIGPDDCVYVTAPTWAVDRLSVDPPAGSTDKVYSGFGRPQGLAFDSQGALYVAEALAGWSGLYRVRMDGTADLVVAGQSLVGVAFSPKGGLVVVSNDTAYRLDVPIRPLG
jgi:hypothetical protein